MRNYVEFCLYAQNELLGVNSPFCTAPCILTLFISCCLFHACLNHVFRDYFFLTPLLRQCFACLAKILTLQHEMKIRKFTISVFFIYFSNMKFCTFRVFWDIKSTLFFVFGYFSGNQRMTISVPGSSQQLMSANNNQPRRTLAWAAVRPIFINQSCFDKILSPVAVNTSGGHKVLVTPLEQLLSCHFLWIYIKKVISSKYSKSLVRH